MLQKQGRKIMLGEQSEYTGTDKLCAGWRVDY